MFDASDQVCAGAFISLDLGTPRRMQRETCKVIPGPPTRTGPKYTRRKNWATQNIPPAHLVPGRVAFAGSDQALGVVGLAQQRVPQCVGIGIEEHLRVRRPQMPVGAT